MKYIAAIALALAVGCAHPGHELAIHSYDHPAKKAGKGLARVGLCAITLCVSEALFAQPPPRPLTAAERAVVLDHLLNRRNRPVTPPPVVVPEQRTTNCLGQVGPHGVVSGTCVER